MKWLWVMDTCDANYVECFVSTALLAPKGDL